MAIQTIEAVGVQTTGGSHKYIVTDIKTNQTFAIEDLNGYRASHPFKDAIVNRQLDKAKLEGQFNICTGRDVPASSSGHMANCQISELILDKANRATTQAAYLTRAPL